MQKRNRTPCRRGKTERSSHTSSQKGWGKHLKKGDKTWGSSYTSFLRPR
jgi:hypothetical protein